MPYLRQHETTFRVRYPEVDSMGVVHHANYLIYFEMGRIELARASGALHRDIEAAGQFFVVVKAEVRYHRPARYDDLLRLRTTVLRVTRAKLVHEYRLFRDEELIALGEVTLALVDREGNIMPVPDWMREGHDR